MKIIKSIIISFSLYSKIPMPIFEWDEENMKHAISFLPFVGAVIGGLSYLLIYVGVRLSLPVMVMTLLLTALPLIVTGGFHVDGFMDVQDALHSYQPKEKKLEIMKDPHIGAFAVISVGTLLLIWLAALYLLLGSAMVKEDFSLVYIYMASYFLIRALCGITSIVFRNAKKDGMLNMETGKSSSGDVIFLSIQAVLAIAFMVYQNLLAGVVCAAAGCLFCLWYKKLCDKQFGGVSGDTAGFFVVMGEAFLLIVLAIL
ncbi:adenosylcobinamide-GDP ribazoletransferase [Butyrivibrio sp. AE3006]|uniref:adenosylcobinamide-GDP ribazoletransferase n=1 Tax=Butyrivibrio sp. AE3006 TaxID=1280673 RepID=UPI0003F5DF0E|nr:adenosylcobinamide-GDP ribazoletransferase [Butyrivibrio sp. AE3006]